MLLHLLITVVVLGLVYWATTLLPLPAPFPAIIQVIFIIILIVVLLNFVGVVDIPLRL